MGLLSALAKSKFMARCVVVEPDDADLVAAVRAGDLTSFELLVIKYQRRVFATVRRYTRRESEVEDIAQEVFLKAYRKLNSFRGHAPFEHWLMRLAVRTCYDFLRKRYRSREAVFADLTEEESAFLHWFAAQPEKANETAEAAKILIERVLDELPPQARLIITLLEIEGRSVKEIAALTGWSIPLVKVRAFRARKAMRKCLERITSEKYL
jgi:RNA polymerase sigma-70 factor (ECF subfamily)